MTAPRKEMLAEDYIRRLQDGAHEENWGNANGLGVGGGSLQVGIFAATYDDSLRAHKWHAYVRLIDRLYGGTGLVTVSEDGTRTPWSPERLEAGA